MKLSHEDFKLELLARLQEEVRPFKKVNDKQYATRCPLCGDSRNDKRKMRFYIKIDLYDLDEPVFYNCFNCGEGGILNPSVLKALYISDMPILSGLQAYNKRVAKTNKKYKQYSEKIDVSVPMPDTENPENILKKEYICNRLGIDISFEELVQLKTVFRLGDFLVHNKIEHITTTPQKAMDIHNNYVGWLTANNELINARKVFEDKSEGRRYEKYNLYKDRLGALKFYVMPTQVDTIKPDMIHINMAEGVFDIFGIYYHVDLDAPTDSNIYVAACGSSYRSIIEYFIRQGFVFNVILNIYADTDQDIKIYKDLKKEFGDWFEEFNVYTNAIEKDFGTTANKIRVVKNKV